MPTIRVSKNTLKLLRVVQGYFQLGTGKKISDDETVAELCIRFKKIFPTQIGDKVFMLEIETRKKR